MDAAPATSVRQQMHIQSAYGGRATTVVYFWVFLGFGGEEVEVGYGRKRESTAYKM